MNKEQQELLDEVYQNYSKEYEKDNSIGMCLLVARIDGKSTYRKPNKEMFIDLCTFDTEFSERWGLKIEERELSRDERIDLYCKEYTGGTKGKYEPPFDDFIDAKLTTRDIPTRLITITYNDKTIESYD
jgi:hypothetical protein